MTTQSTYSTQNIRDQGITEGSALETLALIQIGMMLGDYVMLPETPIEAADQIQEVFDIDMSMEPDILIVRDKMIAILEHSNTGDHS